jgi:hypothetical protein
MALAIGITLGALLWIAPRAGLARPENIAATDPVIGELIPISTLSIDESAPAVAYDSDRGEFLVVWHNYRPFADDDIYAQRVSTHGGLLSWFNVDHLSPITGDRNCPAVAYSIHHGDYLVVYSRDAGGGSWDVLGRRVDIYGPQGNEFTIATSTTMPNASEDRPAVAYNSVEDNYLVAWVQPGTDKEIWGRLVAGTAGGGPGGSEFLNTAQNLTSPLSDDCGSPDLAFHPGRNQYMLAFDRYVSGMGSNVIARLVNATGVYSTGAQITISSDGDSPAAAANAAADQYLVAYRYTGGASYTEIWVYSTGGDLSGVVNTSFTPSPGDDHSDPDIANLGDTDLYQVVWSAQLSPPGGRGIRGRRVNTVWDQSPTFDIHVVSLDYENVPAVANSSPTTLVVWEHDGASSYEIFGHLLGYRVYLPLVLRSFFP